MSPYRIPYKNKQDDQWLDHFADYLYAFSKTKSSIIDKEFTKLEETGMCSLIGADKGMEAFMYASKHERE